MMFKNIIHSGSIFGRLGSSIPRFLSIMANTNPSRVVWIDMEMTGLEISKDHIMEVACLITDSNLNIVAEGPELILHQPDAILNSMHEWCVKQHGKTGLTDACRNSKTSLQEAEETLYNFISRHVLENCSPLAAVIEEKMVFGEIVEPSSRALLEDDFVEYPEDEGLELHWDENLKLPQTVNKLLIGETSQIITLLKKCVLQHTKPLCELTKIGLSIYKIENNSYVVIYRTQPDVIVGKITEKLIPWLNAAQDICVLTSASIASLQNCNHTETSSCIVRSLSSKNVQISKYLRLEVPNMVTGLGASVMSYSKHRGLTCSLYIGFLEKVPLDSRNTQSLVEVLRYVGISPLTNYVLEDKAPSNNLYT